MTWQGDALAAVSAGRGVHVMHTGLCGAAQSLINKAAVPTAPSISPASPPVLWGSLHLIPSSALWGSRSKSCHIRAMQLLSISAGKQIVTASMLGEPGLWR